MGHNSFTAAHLVEGMSNLGCLSVTSNNGKGVKVANSVIILTTGKGKDIPKIHSYSSNRTTFVNSFLE